MSFLYFLICIIFPHLPLTPFQLYLQVQFASRNAAKSRGSPAKANAAAKLGDLLVKENINGEDDDEVDGDSV